MDHQGFAQLLGNYGEFIGAIAVVVTLLYLARQINQNSMALDTANERASSALVHEGNVFYAQVFSQLACDAELASIYQRALAKESLDATERVRFIAFVNTYLAYMEDVYFQSKGQLIAEFTRIKGEEIVGQFYPYWGELMKTETVREWWTHGGSAQFVPDFVLAVNDVLAKQGEDFTLE